MEFPLLGITLYASQQLQMNAFQDNKRQNLKMIPTYSVKFSALLHENQEFSIMAPLLVSESNDHFDVKLLILAQNSENI